MDSASIRAINSDRKALDDRVRQVRMFTSSASQAGGSGGFLACRVTSYLAICPVTHLAQLTRSRVMLLAISLDSQMNASSGAREAYFIGMDVELDEFMVGVFVRSSACMKCPFFLLSIFCVRACISVVTSRSWRS